MPPDLVPLDELFRRLLDLIADECWKAGYLPARFRKGITEGRKP